METINIKCRLTFTEGLLGTASANPDIHAEFIASKAPDAATAEEEIAAIGVDEYIDKQMTVFPRDSDGRPCLYDYQVKGFFKESCRMLRGVPGTKSSKIKAYKKAVDGHLFVFPRMIPLNFPQDLGDCQRPMRGQTMQGERITLKNSEEAPIGTTVEFEIMCLTEEMHGLVLEALDYGKLLGLGQWRSSGKGRFVWEQV